MKQNLNIRIEKKPAKYIGPKVVSIDTFIKRRLIKKFATYLSTAKDMILISKDIDGSNHGYTSFSETDTIYMLEKIKKSFLE